jgi:hypothetical protein
MLRDIAHVLVTASFGVFILGWVWSVYTVARLKNWNWIIGLLFFGPFAYPFFAIMYRKTSRISFHAFWLSLVLFLVGGVFARASNPPAVASASIESVGALAVASQRSNDAVESDAPVPALRASARAPHRER